MTLSGFLAIQCKLTFISVSVYACMWACIKHGTLMCRLWLFRILVCDLHLFSLDWSLLVWFLTVEIKLPGTFRNIPKPSVSQNKTSSHLSLHIFPIVQHFWLPLSSPLLSLSPLRFAFSFSSEHKHWNMKVFTAIFLDLYSPHPKQKRREEKIKRPKKKCSQWGLEPKLKESGVELGVYKTINKQSRKKK